MGKITKCFLVGMMLFMVLSNQGRCSDPIIHLGTPDSPSNRLRVVLNLINPKAFPDIELNFTVFDPTGTALEQIQRENLALSEDGIKINNFFMEVANEPVRLGIVLDDSGSMHFQLKPLLRAVSRFLTMLGPQDSAFIMSFADGVQILEAESRDKGVLTRSLKKLRGFGATALYDALVKAADLLPAQGKTAIILLSDGVDQNRENTEQQSAHSAIQAVSKVARKKIPIHAIGLGKRVNREELKDFGRLTGGSFYYAPSIAQLEDLYTFIARNLKSDVRMRFVSPRNQLDASTRSIELSVRYGNLSGRDRGSYVSPGKFVFETSSLGYDSKRNLRERDRELEINLTSPDGRQSKGDKGFMGRWLDNLGK